MYPYLGWVLPAAFVASLILWIVRAASRRQIRSIWVYCALGLVLWLLYPSGQGGGSAMATAFAELAVLQLLVSALEVAVLQRVDAPKFIAEILIAGGYLAVLFSLLAHIGLNVTGLIATSAVATAVMGLALQDLLINFVGGVVLELEQTVKVGDWIRVEQSSGVVTGVRIRHAVIETADHDTVLVPNSTMMRSEVTIVSRKHRRVIPFYLPYGCDPAAVTEAVANGLGASPINGVCAEPKARCILLEFNPQYVAFGVLAWLSDPPREMLAVSAILMRVHYALVRAGQPLMSISTTVDLNQLTAPDANFAEKKNLEILKSTPLFRSLPEDSAQRIGPSLKHATYGPGEYVIRQGDDGDSMYVIISGTVDVHIESDAGVSEYVATLEPGQFFGEMSLLTGEQRTANVMAMTRVECLVVHRDGLSDLFQAHPEIVSEISGIIAHRQTALTASREKLDDEHRRVQEARNRRDLVERIQRYFGIGQSSAAN